MDNNSSKIFLQAESLKMSEPKFEDATGDDLQETQNKEKQLQKMKMDFEENDTGPGQNNPQGQPNS